VSAARTDDRLGAEIRRLVNIKQKHSTRQVILTKVGRPVGGNVGVRVGANERGTGVGPTWDDWVGNGEGRGDGGGVASGVGPGLGWTGWCVGTTGVGPGMG
jgi:hypothetical protein